MGTMEVTVVDRLYAALLFVKEASVPHLHGQGRPCPSNTV